MRRLGVIAVAATLSCGDDTAPGGSDPGGGGQGGGVGGAGQGGTGGSGGVAEGGGGASEGGGGGGGAPPVDAGHPGMDLVSAVRLASSPNFKMTFTLGQSSLNQHTSRSTNFRMQGGLQGANGSLP